VLIKGKRVKHVCHDFVDYHVAKNSFTKDFFSNHRVSLRTYFTNMTPMKNPLSMILNMIKIDGTTLMIEISKK